MRFISAVCASAILAVAVIAASSSDALAQRNRGGQATTVVVVNSQRVLAELAIGRDMTAKLQTVRAQIGQEAQSLGPEGQSIEQERQRLTTATRNMTPEQVRASSTYAPQFQALSQRLEQFQRRSQGLQGDFECSQLIALREFNEAVTPIVRSVMQSRGAGVVLDAGNIQVVAPEYDITNAVIQQLDQSARASNASRHAVTECQAPQAPQAPPAQ